MGFAIPLMLINLLICWCWLTFIGMRLFGPGRQTTYKENEKSDGDNEAAYVNYALEPEVNEDKASASKKSSIEEKDTEISLQDLNTNEPNRKLYPSFSVPEFSRDNSKTGANYPLINETFLNIFAINDLYIIHKI